MRVITLNSQVLSRISAKVESTYCLEAARQVPTEDISMCGGRMPVPPSGCLGVFSGNSSTCCLSHSGMPGHAYPQITVPPIITELAVTSLLWVHYWSKQINHSNLFHNFRSRSVYLFFTFNLFSGFRIVPDTFQHFTLLEF